MNTCNFFKILMLSLTISCYSCKNRLRIKGADTYTRQVCTSNYSDLLKKQVYIKMEIEPEFPGGIGEYIRYMNRNVKCTEEMIEKDNRRSSIGFTFLVDTDGQIKYPAFHGSIDTTDFNPLEKEIYRVLKLMPKWTPAMCNGKIVAAEVKRSLLISVTKD